MEAGRRVLEKQMGQDVKEPQISFIDGDVLGGER